MTEFLNYDNGVVNEVNKTFDGFLRLKGTIASVGWLTYLNKDGETQKQYVSEETLFDPDHLTSIAGAPLTYMHEGGFIDPSTYRKYVVGSTGTKVIANTVDGVIDIVLIVQDKKAIEAVESRKITGLSMGYRSILTKNEDGTFTQTKRICNHNSLVPRGRCPKAMLHLDGWFQDEKGLIKDTLPHEPPEKKENFIFPQRQKTLITYKSSLNLVI